ncbi:uncharacterized protein [Patagioenas fasciata]|uniref:uncharacterized protein n=1 Tax=Patagioenas fasciata TaxID=372321 RepID=UPI003A993440
MDIETAAALLTTILSKRGIESSQEKLITLIFLAQKWGHFGEVPLLFSPTEWRSVGDTMWDKTIRGVEEKEIKAVRELWKTVLESLEVMKSEQRAALRAAEAIVPEQTWTDKTCPKEKRGLWATLWGLPAVRGGRGVPAQPILSQSDLQRGLETARLVNKEPEVSPSESLGQCAKKAEVQLVDCPDVGGPECRPPPTAPPLPCPEPDAPPPSEKSAGPAAAQPPGPGPPQTLPPQAPAEVFCEPPPTSLGSPQAVEQLLQVITNKLEQLNLRVSNVEKNKEQIEFQKPACPSQTMQSKVPIDSTDQPQPQRGRWSGVIKDAILEGDWSPAKLALPVIQNMNTQTTVWEPHDWKILQQAKQTTTSCGIRSAATRHKEHLRTCITISDQP